MTTTKNVFRVRVLPRDGASDIRDHAASGCHVCRAAAKAVDDIPDAQTPMFACPRVRDLYDRFYDLDVEAVRAAWDEGVVIGMLARVDAPRSLFSDMMNEQSFHDQICSGNTLFFGVHSPLCAAGREIQYELNRDATCNRAYEAIMEARTICTLRDMK